MNADVRRSQNRYPKRLRILIGKASRWRGLQHRPAIRASANEFKADGVGTRIAFFDALGLPLGRMIGYRRVAMDRRAVVMLRVIVLSVFVDMRPGHD